MIKRKNSLKKFLTGVLSVIIMLSFANAYAPNGNSAIVSASNFVNGILDGAFRITETLFPTPDYPTVKNYYASKSKNLFEGTDRELVPTADIIRESDSDKTVLVIGLCNDAIGYIIPDNDFTDSLLALEIGDYKLVKSLSANITDIMKNCFLQAAAQLHRLFQL